MNILILAERCNTFLSLRPLRPLWGHLGSQGLPDASQMTAKFLVKNHNFGYESGPRGSPRHDTLLQRSAPPPGSFLSTSRPLETPLSTQEAKEIAKIGKDGKLETYSYGSPIPLFGFLRWGHPQISGWGHSVIVLPMHIRAAAACGTAGEALGGTIPSWSNIF